MAMTDQDAQDVADVGRGLEAAGLTVHPRLFAALLKMAAMGAVSFTGGWSMSRQDFLHAAGQAYDWARSRHVG